MKKTACFVCMLLLLLTVFSIPIAVAMPIDFSGEWVCLHVDLGDGVLLSEYEGQTLQDSLRFELHEDNTAVLNSFGIQQEGTWMPTGAGIAMVVDDLAVPFTFTDDQLVNTDDGITMYFVRATNAGKGGFSSLLNMGKTDTTAAFSFAGFWECVAYEAAGVSYDIAMFFPDGLTMTLSPDGTGTVALTADYSESITWNEDSGDLAVNGSYVLFGPEWDAETQVLSLHYATDSVRILFEKTDSDTQNEPTNTGTLPQIYECEFFTAAFPENWQQDEFNTYNWDEFYSVQYNLNDENGWSVSTVKIDASIEDVVDYRNEMDTLQDYVQKAGNDTLDTVEIDGITFQGATYGDYWTYVDYIARVPEASVTLSINISSPEEITDVLPAILNSIHLSYPIPDTPYVDPPLSEDGVAFVPSPTTVSVAGFEVAAQWLQTDTPIIPKDIYSGSIAAVDGTVYVLSGSKLYPLSRSGAMLTGADNPMLLDGDFRFLSAAWDGMLYITDGYYEGVALQDGVTESFAMDGYLTVSPDGQWGLSYWSSSDVKRIAMTDDGLATKAWVLQNLSDDDTREGRFSSADYILITDEHIYVAGSDATADSATRIAMFDLDGNELATFGSADWMDDSAISSVAGIVETNNSILVQDGFYGNLLLFAMDGTFIGFVNGDELLGTDNPWPIAMTASENGALVLVSQERNDNSATELLVLEITGF